MKRAIVLTASFMALIGPHSNAGWVTPEPMPVFQVDREYICEIRDFHSAYLSDEAQWSSRPYFHGDRSHMILKFRESEIDTALLLDIEWTNLVDSDNAYNSVSRIVARDSTGGDNFMFDGTMGEGWLRASQLKAGMKFPVTMSWSALMGDYHLTAHMHCSPY